MVSSWKTSRWPRRREGRREENALGPSTTAASFFLSFFLSEGAISVDYF